MLMPLTASTMPSRVRKRTRRFSTERIVSFIAITSPILRVERIAQTIANEIQREQRRDEEESRKQQKPVGGFDILGALRDQNPPACHRFLDAEPQEGQEA